MKSIVNDAKINMHDHQSRGANKGDQQAKPNSGEKNRSVSDQSAVNKVYSSYENGEKVEFSPHEASHIEKQSDVIREIKKRLPKEKGDKYAAVYYELTKNCLHKDSDRKVVDGRKILAGVSKEDKEDAKRSVIVRHVEKISTPIPTATRTETGRKLDGTPDGRTTLGKKLLAEEVAAHPSPALSVNNSSSEVLLAAASNISSNTTTQYVSGYTKSNGTEVSGYTREISSPAPPSCSLLAPGSKSSTSNVSVPLEVTAASSNHTTTQYVSGYTKSNGTEVSGYTREISSPGAPSYSSPAPSYSGSPAPSYSNSNSGGGGGSGSYVSGYTRSNGTQVSGYYRGGK